MRYLSILAKCTVLLAALTLTTGTWGSQGKGNPAGKSGQKTGGEVQVKVGVRLFPGQNRDVIRQYISKLPSDDLPPGLAKRGGSLPPGQAKQLRKNGKLPPGLQKRLHAFPIELEKRLPPLAPGLKRGFIEGRAVIYNEKTSVILDIFIPL